MKKIQQPQLDFIFPKERGEWSMSVVCRYRKRDHLGTVAYELGKAGRWVDLPRRALSGWKEGMRSQSPSTSNHLRTGAGPL